MAEKVIMFCTCFQLLRDSREEPGGQKGEREGAGSVGGKERGKSVGGKERGREMGKMNPNKDQRVEGNH